MNIYDEWFIFNGINSRSMGVWVTAMPPTVRAEKRVDTIEVDGRSGALHITDGTYANYTRTMECAIRDRRRIDEVCAWLQGGGEAIFSSEPDKVYRIYIANQIPIESMMRTFQHFQVTMDTYPFKYNVNALDDELDVTTAINIYNMGTIYSEPVITVTPTGSAEPMPMALDDGYFSITINGKIYQLQNLTEPVVIDSELSEVYTLDGQNANNLYLSDEFPRLETGVNSVSFNNLIAKLHIKPNWRWL